MRADIDEPRALLTISQSSPKIRNTHNNEKIAMHSMQRSRKFSRSRGGCSRCRVRRVKCDESKPQCETCRTEGVPCPGYARRIRWSAKHERFQNEHARQMESVEDDYPTSLAVETNEFHRDESHQDASHPSRLPPTNDTVTSEPPLWPDFDACTYEALGLSDNWLLDLDLQFAFQQPPHLEAPASQIVSNRFGSATGIPEAPAAEPTDANAAGPRDGRVEKETSSNSSKNLLQTYYRLSGHGRVFGLTDEAFVEYYFENVCGIYSCFDSAMNPFRSEVERHWTSSPAMYYTIQTMAIGHLANYYPYLAPLGLQKRSQAWEYLQRDLRSSRISTTRDNMLLLNLLLLGMSSAWHQASNLGIQYILIARELMQRRLKTAPVGRVMNGGSDARNESFFECCLLYWEMLISFVDPVPLAPLHVKLELPTPSVATDSSPATVHSWCGIISEVQFALAEIGRLLRRRQSYRARLQTDEAHTRTSDKEWVQSLEAFLLAIEMPAEAHIEHYDDVKTSKADFIAVADAYRFVGLLEVYWLYPEFLQSRIEDRHPTLDGLDLPMDISLQGRYERLGVFASHILDLVKPISITSGVCRLMPLIFVVAAGHLRFPSTSNSAAPVQRDDVIQSRYVVEARMLVLSRKYPQKPLLQMTDIIKELWQRLDNGDSNAHWMDVVHELGWQTLMG